MISILKIDFNGCFKWSKVRYLNPANYHPARITKADKDFVETLDIKDIKFPVKIGDIHKIEKNTSINISIFGYENKKNYPICVSKKRCEEKYIDLLFLGEGENNTNFLSRISIGSCMILHCIAENIFHVIFYLLK